MVVGVGPGFGFAVARKLSKAGMRVALASRNAERLDNLVAEISQTSTCAAFGCDATDEISVKNLMSLVCRKFGTPDLVIYSVQGYGPGRTLDIEVPAFEECWRQNCLGAFIVSREAARRMVPLARGTIVLVGSTSGLIGRADHLNLAVGKFGLRALSQVMARELAPQGIHVLHLVIDGDIREHDCVQPGALQMDPEDVADLLYAMHLQPRSAWTSELDIRPSSEQFWQHC